MKNSIQIIQEERQRQILVEGYTDKHDDEHGGGEMAFAASCYARYAGYQSEIDGSEFGSVNKELVDSEWPWELSWWKPEDSKIKNLAKAGALIAAEIDRIQRIK